MRVKNQEISTLRSVLYPERHDKQTGNLATGLDPSKLTVRTYLNGKLMQEGRTEDMVFSVPFLIHYLSQCMTLFPGDIISTGTPKGIGPMKPGDIVEVTIEEIGSLRNPVKALG